MRQTDNFVSQLAATLKRLVTGKPAPADAAAVRPATSTVEVYP